jgi:membrane-associated protease RseP (regulator of RpoE activity)
MLEEVYRPQRLTLMQILLFAATCVTTTQIGTTRERSGLWYSVPLIFTLLCHEFGHFLQARRWKVMASWPYFIPILAPPLGTMGAVIAMRGHMGNRKALFDIGISGPLAGLVPTMIFSVIGLSMSEIVPIPPVETHSYGEPLLFTWIARLMLGPLPPGHDILLHPIAFAGWVGMFITALNLIPIGQLDGGHVLYALLRGKAHVVAQLALAGAILAVVATGNWGWTLMLMLLLLMGPNHPPTADDSQPLGTGRTILGWLTLCFIFVGFTPQPFK